MALKKVVEKNLKKDMSMEDIAEFLDLDTGTLSDLCKMENPTKP